MSFNNSYSDYTNDFSSAYVREHKVKIDMDKYAMALYTWLQQQNKVDYQIEKPQIEDFLVVLEAPSTAMAKSSKK